MTSMTQDVHGPLGNRLLLLGVSTLAMTLLALFADQLSRADLRQIALTMILGETLLGILIARSDPRGVWGFPFLYFLILAVFHSGLFLSPALLDKLPLSLSRSNAHWYASPGIERAGYIICVGMVCYSLGYALSSLRPQKAPRVDPGRKRESDTIRSREGIVDAGGAITVVCVAGWFLIGALSSGPLFFLGSYLAFLQVTGGSALPWIYLGISMGLMMCALDIGRGMGKMGVTAFVIFSLPAFLLGLRGEVLFPLIAALAVVGSTRKLFATRYFVVACVVALLAISFVAQVRVEGIGSVGVTSVAVSPVRAVEEMGHSVRPLSTSIEWHEDGHEPYLSGGTYVAPFDRQIRGLLGLYVPDAAQDPRLMNVEIADRVGNIGGSIMAEAHHNWGVLGVGFVLLATGALTGQLFRRGMGPVGLALSGVLAILLLMHVRNSFAPLPVWGAVGVLLVLMGIYFGKLHTPSARAKNGPVRVAHAQRGAVSP